MSLQECLPLTNVSLPVFSCQNVLRISIAASFLDLLLSKTRESGIMDNLRSETANNFGPPCKTLSSFISDSSFSLKKESSQSVSPPGAFAVQSSNEKSFVGH